MFDKVCAEVAPDELIHVVRVFWVYQYTNPFVIDTHKCSITRSLSINAALLFAFSLFYLLFYLFTFILLIQNFLDTLFYWMPISHMSGCWTAQFVHVRRPTLNPPHSRRHTVQLHNHPSLAPCVPYFLSFFFKDSSSFFFVYLCKYTCLILFLLMCIFFNHLFM